VRSNPTPDRLPDFLVVGAAKAGTTALHEYLGQHPEVFLPAHQEPSFFAFEGQQVAFRGPGDSQAAVNRTAVASLQEYQALFAPARADTVRGEVSPIYLYWPGTAERIRGRLPNTKICVILRDPVDRAFSSYMHAVREGKEPSSDFMTAVEAEPRRITENWGFLWRYTDLGHYPSQLRRYFEAFPREQVHVALYDDLRVDALGLCQRLFAFLGVDPSFRPDTGVRHNVSGQPRSRTLHTLFRRDGLLGELARAVAPVLGRDRLRRTQVRLTTANLETQTLPPDHRAELVARFRPEVEELAEMLGRDLSAWLQPDYAGPSQSGRSR